MTAASSYPAAFLVALLGGVHCVGMCGGIVGAITWGLTEPIRSRFAGLLPYLLAYNLGRIASYTVAGALAGGIGAWAAHLVSVRHAQQVLQLLAGLFMMLLGLYLGGWWQGLSRLERAGGIWWRWIEPVGRRWLPIRSLRQALGVGLIWGWLPCGLVYSVVIWAVSAGSASQGALLMLSFGLGTLPTLLAMGAFAATLTRWMRQVWVRRLAGGLVMLFALGQIGSVWIA
ncbi:MAG: sulfite exporter TauE/SafE family protein [Gammaproteobacteria bacterium]|nr:sulfite exporter TauE/SafE family protein [Gammaproteobacteria bacterium]MCP5426197.1 sulfite exporter TauE/SafE family protein [Gammaproteobacteria bacterium]